MNNKYKQNPEVMKEFGNIIDEKLSNINNDAFYQRKVSRELGISNATVSRIVGGLLGDMKVSTFIALCKYANITDEEILSLYHMAISDLVNSDDKVKSRK